MRRRQAANLLPPAQERILVGVLGEGYSGDELAVDCPEQLSLPFLIDELPERALWGLGGVVLPEPGARRGCVAIRILDALDEGSERGRADIMVVVDDHRPGFAFDCRVSLRDRIRLHGLAVRVLDGAELTREHLDAGGAARRDGGRGLGDSRCRRCRRDCRRGHGRGGSWYHGCLCRFSGCW